MIVAITGHTSGIGLAIAEWCRTNGHDIIGLSRSTGYDLGHADTVIRMVGAALGADVMVNNAFWHYAQVDLLYAMFDIWKDDANKIIVNVSSNSGDGIKRYRHPYAVQKAALDKAVAQLQTVAACHILNIRPGYVDTPRVKEVVAPKLSPHYVAEIIGWMIEQQGHIKTLTVTP